MWRGLVTNFSMKHAVVAEAGEPLAPGRLEALAHVLLTMGEPHALAAAAGRGLHHHRIADLGGDPDGLVGIGDLAQEAGHDADPGGLRQLLQFDLVAHRRDRLGRRADEGDAGVGERAAKLSRSLRKP